jgi:hypothetical protein
MNIVTNLHIDDHLNVAVCIHIDEQGNIQNINNFINPGRNTYHRQYFCNYL